MEIFFSFGPLPESFFSSRLSQWPETGVRVSFYCETSGPPRAYWGHSGTVANTVK